MLAPHAANVIEFFRHWRWIARLQQFVRVRVTTREGSYGENDAEASEKRSPLEAAWRNRSIRA